MDQLLIEGGIPLKGEVRPGRAKNAVLKMMAAAMLAEGPCVLHQVPRIRDVQTMAELLRHLGLRVEWRPGGEMRVASSGTLRPEAPDHLVRQLRASIQVMGPLVAVLGKARVSYPGGCAIGARPVDLHLKGLQALGAEVREAHGYIEVSAPRLVGTVIQLDYPSVGATENLAMAACLAEGTTWIHNAAREPEVVDTLRFLQRMGARIQGAGTDCLVIEGVRRLDGAEYTPIPDRIETATFLVAACITGGEVTVRDCLPEHLVPVLAKLREAGAQLKVGRSEVRMRGPQRPGAIRLRTQPHPGFPTDVQPQMVALAAVASGVSIITEEVYTSRFKHVEELRRMGADVTVEGRTAIVRGVAELTGARLEATDLRAGAAIALGALAARGESVIEGVHHIDRGYEDFGAKLQSLGARVRRVQLTRQEECLA